MNKKISISIAHNRKIKSSFLLGNNEAKSNEKKNPTMLESQERNFLAQKCKVKYNSFISGKSFHKTIMNNNSKDSYMNLVKSQKKYNLNNSKKELISNTSNNILLKQNKIVKTAKIKNKNKYKNYFYNIDNILNKNNEKSLKNFDRINHKINEIYLDYENSSNSLNKSNFTIKVKTIKNQYNKNHLLKKINNINFSEINNNGIDNKRNAKSFKMIEENKKKNNIENKKNLLDIFKNTKNLRRVQYSNNIASKHFKYFRNCQKGQKNFLEKTKFIQLWWKTIFQIIKIQKHLRGFLYRQKLIEELDKEEIEVDKLLFFIRSYKKIVFKIFIIKLDEYKTNNRYYFMKWNERTNKRKIISKLLELFKIKKYKNNFNSICNNKNCNSSDLIKFDYDCDKNINIRDSTNSLINNNENEIKNNKKFFNNFFPSISNNRRIENKNISNNMLVNNIHNSFNKINNDINQPKRYDKKKKILKNKKEKKNYFYGSFLNNKKFYKNIQQENEYDYANINSDLILSNTNKIKSKIKNNINTLNTNIHKLENKNKINITSNFKNEEKSKKNKMKKKLISKDVISFSMINNNDNISSEFNLNSLDNIIFPNKKLKIYENHLQEYGKSIKNKKISNNNDNKIKIRKKSNKNINQIEVKKTDEPSKLIFEKNLMTTYLNKFPRKYNNSNNNNLNLSDNNYNNHYFYQQNQVDISNNKYSINSKEITYRNLSKLNQQNMQTNKVSQYFKFWYDKIYYGIIKNKLRGYFLLLKNLRKIMNNEMLTFFGNFKYYYNLILKSQIKNLFNKCIIEIIKKSIIKCYIYKMFNAYHEKVYKKIIFQKLKEYLIQNHIKIINEIQDDINNLLKEKKNNFNYIRKKLIINNKNNLSIKINPLIENNSLLLSDINSSMLNLIHPKIPINLNTNDNAGYTLTDENKRNKNIKNDIIIETLNIRINNNNNIDTVAQLNQLAIVINIIETLRLKNDKKKNLSISNYFTKWKKDSINKVSKKNSIKQSGDHTIPTDVEEFGVTKYTLNDNYQSESDFGVKTVHNDIQNNTIESSKYVPIRGLKYLQGKIKQKINPINDNIKYNINTLIDKYKTTTIEASNNYNYKTYYKNGSPGNNIKYNSKTFNNMNKLILNNKNITNDANNIKIQKNKISESLKNQNSNVIYHKKPLCSSFKNNVNTEIYQ